MENENEVAESGLPEGVPDMGARSETTPDAKKDYDERVQDILDENIGTLLELMSELKSDITDEWHRVKMGEANEKDLTKKIKVELPALVALTMQQESRLHDHSIQRSGKAGEFALDLGTARAAIGERLARLRAAGRAEGVS